MQRGIIYFADGPKKYFDEAYYSAKSLRKHMPDVPIALITTSDDQIKRPFCEKIKIADTNDHPFRKKIKAILSSPYDSTIFIDTDTEIKNSFWELFDFLRQYDICIANRIDADYPANETPIFKGYVDQNNFNTGFICYRKNQKVLNFLQEWYQVSGEWQEKLKNTYFGDQEVFNHLVFNEKAHIKYGVEICKIPNKIYNARPWMWKQLKKDKDWNKVKIFHAHNLNKNLLDHARTIKGKLMQKYFGV